MWLLHYLRLIMHVAARTRLSGLFFLHWGEFQHRTHSLRWCHLSNTLTGISTGARYIQLLEIAAIRRPETVLWLFYQQGGKVLFVGAGARLHLRFFHVSIVISGLFSERKLRCSGVVHVFSILKVIVTGTRGKVRLLCRDVFKSTPHRELIVVILHLVCVVRGWALPELSLIMSGVEFL